MGRNAVYSMHVSLDGYVEGPNRELDWADPDAEVDCARIWLVMPKVVFSKTLERVEWNTDTVQPRASRSPR
jgi:hypothetical protein